MKDITTLWNDDMVAFLLGCSFSFESALEAAGLGVRHNEEGKNVPMYKTNIPCRPAGMKKEAAECHDSILRRT